MGSEMCIRDRDSITRSKVEELIYEVSYKFLVNKNFDMHSQQYKLISMMNADSDYQEYVLLVKIYMSLCSINKSVEVDYYKIKVSVRAVECCSMRFLHTSDDWLPFCYLGRSMARSTL